MKAPAIPADEAARLAALRAYDILDTEPEPELDALVRVAAYVAGTPIALVSLVDADRQWFKARYGMDAVETSRRVAFCGHVVADAASLVVEDALLDERFADNPLVLGEPNVRFYAGLALRTADGYVLGTLCAIDRRPRTLTAEQRHMLALLAEHVVAHLETRRRNVTLGQHARALDAYRTFFDSSEDLFGTVDAELRVTQLNGAWERVAGWSKAELQAVSLAELIHPEDLEQSLAEAERVRRDHSSTVSFENRLRRKDGTYVPLSWTGTSDGTQFYVSARDMSVEHARRADAARRAHLAEVGAEVARAAACMDDVRTLLQASVASIRAGIRAIAAAVWTVDERGAHFELQAYDGAVPAPERWAGHIRVDDPVTFRAAIDGPLLADPPQLVDGIPLRARFPLRADDRPIGVVAVFRDAPLEELEIAMLATVADTIAIAIERLRTVARLRDFQSTLDRTRDGIVILDGDTLRVTYANDGAVELLGRERASVLASTAYDLLADSEHDQLRRSLAEAERGGISRFDATVSQTPGDDVPVEISLQRVRDPALARAAWIGVFRDISARRRVERLQSEFISTVSHELRTPLTSIRGSLGLVSAGVTGPLPPEAKEYIDIALSNSERLVRLINDILDVEKMESGRVEFRFESIPLRDLFARVGVAVRGAEIAWPVAPPELEVVVDPDRFVQVLVNLVSNAAKFSPAGERVEIRSSTREDRVRIEVRDHGPGIPKQFRERVFQRFAQADTSITRERGGTGLGLSIAKTIVERMRGTIGFEDAIGGGTIFFVELPALPSAHETSSDTASRVLVCEDDPAVYRSIVRTLESAGYAADIAPTLARARELLRRRRYDAVTLDLALADGEGSDLIADLGEHHPALPIVVVSGANRDLGRSAVLVSEVLSKPFCDEQLLDVIRKVLAACAANPPRLLHVEDDEDIRRVVRRTLPEAWHVLGADSVRQARELLAANVFDAVVIDLGLPDGNGAELIEIAGSARVIIFSARDVQASLSRRVSAALVKGRSTAQELREVISSVVTPRSVRAP